MLSGTLIPAVFLSVSTNRSVALNPMGRSRISQGTLHLVSRARAAAPEANLPKAIVAMLSPVLIRACTVTPPLGNISYLPVCGRLRTREVSGNMTVRTPITSAIRLISSMSDGST